MKARWIVIGLIVFTSVIILFTNGCSTRHTDIEYINPNWTPDGKIICEKHIYSYTVTSGWDIISDQTHDFYITEMDVDGSNETDLFKINTPGNPNLHAHDSQIAVSPDNTKIAYTGTENGVGKIYVVDKDGNSIAAITSAPGDKPDSLDWAPTTYGNRIVYGANQEIRSVNIDTLDDTLITKEARDITWRYGDKIVFTYQPESNPAQIAYVSYNSLNTINIIKVGNTPHVIQPGKIFYKYGLQLRTINFDGSDDTLEHDNFTGADPNILIDGTKIVYGIWDESIIKRVYVTNIDGSDLQQLR